MIAGDRCTRACGFCAVKTAKPFALEVDEPQRVAQAVQRMKLNHIVITAVALVTRAGTQCLTSVSTVRMRRPTRGIS